MARAHDAAPLPPAAADALEAVLQQHPQVRRAVLYGSRALGRQRPGSDIDLSLEGIGLDQRLLARIEAELDERLLPWRFDLCIRPQLHSAELIAHIERVGIPVYERIESPC